MIQKDISNSFKEKLESPTIPKSKIFQKLSLKNLWKAIEQMAGWGAKKGTIRSLEKKAQITEVHFDKHGVIDIYHIEGYGWVSKTMGIDLAEAGKVDAVVCVTI